MSVPSQSYIQSVSYPDFFHPEQAPIWLAAVMAGLGQAVPGRRGTLWCELGCGRGFGATLLAAVNPEMEFHGIDINPEHIAQARLRAKRVGIRNITFHCADIREDPLPGVTFDFISCFGVLSWVPAEVRRALVAFTARHLAPAGVASMHYMADPGGAVLRGFHAVFRALAGREDALAQGFAQLDAMAEAGAGFFQLYPVAKQALAALKRERPAYIAHEYLNPDFAPLAFQEVAGLYKDHGLDWQGSANPLENIDALSVPEAAAQVIRGVDAGILRETLKDLARNQTRRHDLFSWPRAKPSPAAHYQLLDGFIWALLPGAPKTGAITLQTPIGVTQADAAVTGPLLAALHQGPARFSALARIPVFAQAPALLNQGLQMLLQAGIAHPVLPGFDPAPAQRFNTDCLLQDAADLPGLAAPALGSGRAFTAAELADLQTRADPLARRLFALD